MGVQLPPKTNMTIRNPICVFRSIVRSLKARALVSGCNYIKDENTPSNVHIAKCEICGHVDFGWTWPVENEQR